MRSELHDVLPARVRRSLVKLGRDLATARRKRTLTVAMMAERLAVSKGLYLRIEKGDPTVQLGAYAMAFFVLGFGDPLASIADPRNDPQGLALDEHRLPRRVRVKKEPVGS